MRIAIASRRTGRASATLVTASVIVVAAAALASRASAQGPSGAQAAAVLEQTLIDAIERASKSVVAIARVDPVERRRNGDPFGARARTPADDDFVPDHFGTGIVIDAGGLILTQHHVVGAKSEHHVTTPDRKVYRAEVVAADPRSDLAVLKINAKDLTPIRFGDGSKLKRGQIVVALGNPYAIARDGQASASWGIIANLSRKVPPDASAAAPTVKDKLYHFGTLIQTDAKLNLGTSGGALVNRQGEMIGLTTSLAATAGYEQAAGYAIPVDDVFRRAIETLKKGAEVEYGFLGIHPENLADADLAAGRRGVRVNYVYPGTPADRAGLQTLDIVTRVDGQPVQDSDSLILQVGRKPVESMVRLTVLRDSRPRTVEVELTKFPVRGEKIVTSPMPAWRGLRVDYATAWIEEFQKVSQSELLRKGCVLITEVERDSPAWEAKLQPGMFVSQVGANDVRSPKEFRTAILGKNGPVEVRVFGGDQLKGHETRVVKPSSG